MAASGYGDRVELIVDINEFWNRVGIIGDYYELQWLGFNLEPFPSVFRPEHIPEMLTFCRENPEYHVVTSITPGRLLNKYVPGRKVYKLAKGDQNPNLLLNPLVNPLRALVDEEVICAALAILGDVKAGNE